MVRIISERVLLKAAISNDMTVFDADTEHDYTSNSGYFIQEVARANGNIEFMNALSDYMFQKAVESYGKTSSPSRTVARA